MILTMDVGNTNIKAALFENNQMKYSWRISTSRTQTSDEYGLILRNLFSYYHLNFDAVEGIIMSSVVPTINYTLEHMCDTFFHMQPILVSTDLNLGIDILYDNPRSLGCDRIANAVGVQAEYGNSSVFIDFGTATTFGAIDENGAFAGGCICPGLKLTSEALVAGTAKLPRFELMRPERAIARDTVSNLQAGVIYGYIGQVQYLVNRFRRELNNPNALVVATGGMAQMVAQEDGIIDRFDPILTLKGLNLIYQRNCGLREVKVSC